MSLAIVSFPDDETNVVRQYSKKELAGLYKCGKNYIPSMINRFLEKFEETGYRKSQKKLNGRQVSLLISLIGGW